MNVDCDIGTWKKDFNAIEVEDDKDNAQAEVLMEDASKNDDIDIDPKVLEEEDEMLKNFDAAPAVVTQPLHEIQAKEIENKEVAAPNDKSKESPVAPPI